MSPRENHCRPRRKQFPMLPSRAVNYIISYWMLIKYIVYITFGFKSNPGQVWIFVFVLRTPYTQTLIRCQSESMMNRTQSRYFLEYHPSSSNITRCQVPSRVRAYFHDSAGDIDFYHMPQQIRINYFTWMYNISLCKISNKTQCRSILEFSLFLISRPLNKKPVYFKTTFPCK